MHTVGAAKPFTVRPALNIATFGTEPHDWLLAHDTVAPEVRTAWQAAYREAMALVAACAGGALSGGSSSLSSSSSSHGIELLRLHGDCHPGNILWTPEGTTTQAPGPHFARC